MTARSLPCIALLLLSGCVYFTVDRYAISPDNVEALRPLSRTPVNLGTIASGKEEMDLVSCRGASVKTTDGESYPAFIQKALLDELRMAGGYSQASPVTLSGTLDRLELSVGGGQWTIGLTIRSSNGKSLSAEEVFEYKTSLFGLGREGCEAAAKALNPAVQNVIGKVVRSPQFVDLAKPL
jgi:hypothetical protein